MSCGVLGGIGSCGEPSRDVGGLDSAVRCVDRDEMEDIESWFPPWRVTETPPFLLRAISVVSRLFCVC